MLIRVDGLDQILEEKNKQKTTTVLYNKVNSNNDQNDKSM